MKNFEHYKDVFMRCKGRNLECVASKKILKRKCANNCAICVEFIKKWLYEEYKEPIKLTEDEKAILRNLPKKYKYITRDSFERIWVHKNKPRKGPLIWDGNENDYFILLIYNHLFQFIKWEDEEPYNIEELLKEK